MNVLQIDLKSDVVKDISITDIFSKVELVQMECSEEAMTDMAKIESVAYSDDRIYILERSGRILVFDYEGRLVDAVEKGGRGHGEFQLGSCMAINDGLGILEVLSERGTIYRYSLSDFSFLESFDLTDHLIAVHSFIPVDNDSYLLYSFSNEHQMSYYNVRTGEFKFLGFDIPEWLSGTVYSPGANPFLRVGDEIHCFRMLDGAFFHFDKASKTLVQDFSLDFGKNQVRESDLEPDRDVFYYEHYIRRNPRKHAASFGFLSEGGSKRFITFIYNGRINYHTLIYDKFSGEHQLLNKTSEGVHLISGTIRGDVMYKITNPGWSYLTINEKVPMDDASREVLDGLSDDSNIILIKYTLK